MCRLHSIYQWSFGTLAIHNVYMFCDPTVCTMKRQVYYYKHRIVDGLSDTLAILGMTSSVSLSPSMIRKPCLSRNLNQVRVEVCFLVTSSR
jgi:hypothetical protein